MEVPAINGIQGVSMEPDNPISQDCDRGTFKDKASQTTSLLRAPRTMALSTMARCIPFKKEPHYLIE